MSDSGDEDFAFFGTPLEPFEEDAVPRKKPVTVEDQIVTDKHGRRRFHGAFTGGFSAGFFNSVGSLEGWKPSAFKSSRNERSQLQHQLPSHFMDEEDTDEFGIAPQVLRTKSEYASTKRTGSKRERHSGPIPGEPVLKSILKPAKRTMGILLLVKMGWKPGQDIGEKLEKTTKKLKPTIQSKRKVYGCARGPEDTAYSTAPHDSSDSDVEDEIYRELGKQAPSFSRKEDTLGLGYKGLDRNTLNFGSKSSQPLRLTDQYNKSIKISGQAFGVGAFEEEDDDIYATEDKSQYDFILEPLSQKPKKPKNVPAVTDGSNVVLGFVKASFKEKVKQYPGPLVPSSFSGKHVIKQSRFNPVPEVQRPESSKQVLDANLRSTILGTQQIPVTIKQEKPDGETSKDKVNDDPSKQNQNQNGGSSWKPFSSDPAKQERYEKYLNLIRIGAKDLVQTVLLNTMSDLERDSEMREFESAARLYKGDIMSDRFTHGRSDDDDTANDREATVPDKVVRKRVTSDWAPHSVVCKRFNIKPPDNVSKTTMQNVAESKKKPKFSVFDFLNTSKTTSLISMIESNAREESDTTLDGKEIKCEIVSGLAVRSKSPDTPLDLDENQPDSDKAGNKNNPTLPFEDDEAFEEPADKMDLFKAIFLDSDEGSDDEKDTQTNEEEKQEINKIGNTVNILRNTSPPRGIFANIDLDKLSNRKPRCENSNDVLKMTAPPQSIFENQTKPEKTTITKEPVELPDDSYGPILPSTTVDKPKSYVNLKLDVNDERWVEKSSSKEKHRSKHHHKKKHKKEKKHDKHKKKKKRKHSSDSSSNSD